MRRQSAQYLNLPFSEAIAFFRQKVNLPTEAWDDLWQGMHSRAFVVAGATKANLLLDMRTAVDKAISKGTTLAVFRKDFDKIVDKHGWQYKGGRDWRTATIYQTNLATAYAAGNHKAMSSPAVQAVRPYLRYIPSTSRNPRRDHMRWYNLVLRHDDPFWQTHRPPNGWGCKCDVTTLSGRELAKLQEQEKDGPAPVQTRAPEQEYYEWTNKKTGEIHKVPAGIDPGWDYNIGEAAWGRQLSKKTMDEHRAMKNDAWEILTPGNWATYGLAEKLQPATPIANAGPKITRTDEAVTALEEIIGGPEQTYSFKAAGGFRYDLLVNAETLISHIDLNRTPYLPFLPETLTDPQEVWQRFDRHKGTGKVVLRQRIIKFLPLGKGKKGLLVICEAQNGWIEAWTMMPIPRLSYLNKQRTGQLVYMKE